MKVAKGRTHSGALPAAALPDPALRHCGAPAVPVAQLPEDDPFAHLTPAERFRRAIKRRDALISARGGVRIAGA